MNMLGKTRSYAPRLALAGVALGGFVAIVLMAQALAFDVTALGVNDKELQPMAHFLVFGTLAVLLAKGAGDRYGLAWCVAMAVATVDEIHQIYVPGRFATLSDWTINLLGITTLLMLAKLLDPVLQYRAQQHKYRKVLIAEGQWQPMRFLRISPTQLKAQLKYMLRQRKVRRRLAPQHLPFASRATAIG